MKKYHLILVCSLVFTLLFYHESVGVNLSIFGLVLTGLICYLFKDKFDTVSHWALVFTSVFSCLAFAWYGDFVSFAALVFSILFLQFRTQDSQLKILLTFPIAFINQFASVVRIFQFNQWLPKWQSENNLVKKIIAYGVIPMVFLAIFFIVYSFGSDHFSGLFFNYELDLDMFQVLAIAALGFYISFSFWNYWVPDYCYNNKSKLDNDFSAEKRNEHRPTFSFLDLDFERNSGVITLFLLNCMLLVFIGTYNYEQFFQDQEVTALSAATHERVNAVIFSIVMAVGVMLFYFKDGFNFDEKAKNLKMLSKVWIVLNGMLIISTIVKNSEYVSYYGLTYKRLGVYAFLVLAIIGLFFTFMKIQKQKANAYLFNQMVWYFYGTVLLCSYLNWGNIITSYNISVNKGIDAYFLGSLDFNEQQCLDYFSGKPDEMEKLKYVKEQVKYHKKDSFLSKALYYETIAVE